MLVLPSPAKQVPSIGTTLPLAPVSQAQFSRVSLSGATLPITIPLTATLAERCCWTYSSYYFQPSNGLSVPTGSISIALKSREQGTSSPPCARQLNISCTLLHCIVPPHRKISEHTCDTFRGKCCMIVLFSQPQSINRKRFQTLKLPLAIFFACVVASNTTIPFENSSMAVSL